MPAPADQPAPTVPPAAPALPRTWRPFGARIAASVFGAMLLAVVVVGWVELGPTIRAEFTFFQRATLVFIGLLAFAVWFALVRSRVTATERGLTVVNGYRRRDYEWAQVLGVFLGRDAPWAGMDLSDGTSVSVLAIQSSDGDRATRAVRDLRRLLAAHSPDGH
ncbi:MAG: PH domain-containing protein [Marmoricola sp.]